MVRLSRTVQSLALSLSKTALTFRVNFQDLVTEKTLLMTLVKRQSLSSQLSKRQPNLIKSFRREQWENHEIKSYQTSSLLETKPRHSRRSTFCPHRFISSTSYRWILLISWERKRQRPTSVLKSNRQQEKKRIITTIIRTIWTSLRKRIRSAPKTTCKIKVLATC